jgi:hypothetical protein
MKINKDILSKIEYFIFAQNVENNEESVSTGTLFDFIENLDQAPISKEDFVAKVSNGMFDELIIYRVLKTDSMRSEDLFCNGTYLTTTNKENWISQIENMQLEIIPMNSIDFKETFGWGINEWLFDHRETNINFPFDSANNLIQIFVETNPLFLGCEHNEFYYLFNYNGYT